MKRDIEKQIIKFYMYSFLKNLLFFLPIVVVFFRNCNLNFTEIFILETIGAIGSVIFEVPTGVIADYFGKKKSLMTGMFISIISCGIFYFGTGFITFTMGYLIWALGGTLLSGADTALLYDVLHGERKNDFKKYQGTARFIGLTGISLSSLMGGYVSSYSMRLNFILTAVAFAVCFMIIATIEHTEQEREKTKYRWIISESFHLIQSNKWILWLFLFSGVFGAVFNIVKPLSQVYMNTAQLDIQYYGIASTYFFLTAAVSAHFANSFEKKFKNWSYLILGITLMASVFIVSSIITKWGFLFFGFVFISMSISSIIVEHEILKSSPAAMNATVLSFNNLFYRLLFAISSPLFGYYLEVFSYKTAMIFMGVILLLTLPGFIFGYVRIFKNKDEGRESERFNGIRQKIIRNKPKSQNNSCEVD